MDTFTNYYLIFWTAVLGLCLGSFFNVVILRSLSGESIVFPPSKCPKCNNKLKPWHNIPVLSYLFLGGKCAFCKEKISIQYPLIELLTMVLYIFCYIKFGLSWKTLFIIVILSCLLIMTVTDLKEKLIDCNIAIGIGVIGLAWNHNFDAVLGLIVGILVFELIARIGYLFFDTRAFGEGDTYVAAVLGACFGLHSLLYILFYSLIASMIFILPVFLYKQFKKNKKLICMLSLIFVLSTLIFKFLLQNYYTLGLLAVSGLALSVLILRDLRNDPCPIYLPLVPAFSLGLLYYLIIQ